jgi:hypothetical protein
MLIIYIRSLYAFADLNFYRVVRLHSCADGLEEKATNSTGGVETNEGRGQGTLMLTLKIDSKICRGAAQQSQRFVYNRNVYNYNVHNPTRYHIHLILGLPQ